MTILGLVLVFMVIAFCFWANNMYVPVPCRWWVAIVLIVLLLLFAANLLGLGGSLNTTVGRVRH